MPGSINCTFENNPAWQSTAFIDQTPQADTIYIWHGITAHLLHLYTNCYALLSIDEQAKANRYFQTADRQRYVIQHGLLRSLLGWFLRLPVSDGAYVHGCNGKPYLPGNNIQSCFFNLSNSAGEFIIAIGDQEMGVDIEGLKTGFAYQDIISQYFGADEKKEITGAENPSETFFLLWTRKEALLKATSKGIDDNLTQVPALNGKHALPDNYNDADWLTVSCRTGFDSLMSITYPSWPMRLQLEYLNGDIAL